MVGLPDWHHGLIEMIRMDPKVPKKFPLTANIEALTPAMRRVLAALREHGPLTLGEIAEHAYVATNTLSGGRYLEHLRNLGHIHIVGWKKNGNGFTTPIYASGRGNDCPRPRFSDGDHDSSGLDRIVEMLQSRGPMTYREIAKASGVSPNTIKNARYMDILLEQQRVHVCNWRRSRNGPPAPVYMAGKGVSASRPDPLSRAERQARWRIRRLVLDGSCSVVKTMMQLMPAA